MELLTVETFKEKIFDYTTNETWNFKGDKNVMIDFYADWCAPCKMIAPTFEELAKDFVGKIDIYKVDTEAEQELSQIFNIRSIPSVLFIPKEGSPRMAVGALPKEGYLEAIKDIFNLELKA